MTSNQQIKIGIFVAGGFILFAISIFLFGGQRAFFTRQITYRAEFDQVQGLSNGSIVSLSGLSIGNVSEINFLPEKNVLEVVFKIDSTYRHRITSGTNVDIRTQGALGDKYVFLSPGNPNGPELPENSVIPTNPEGDLLGRILSRSNNVDRIFDIIDEVHKLVRVINQSGRSNSVMNNLTLATDNLNKSLIEMQILIKALKNSYSDNPNISNSFSHLENILKKIDSGEGSLGALINDPTVHEQIKSLLGQSNRSKFMKSLIRTSIEKSDKEE